MIETTELNILILAWMTLTLIQGLSIMRNKKLLHCIACKFLVQYKEIMNVI